MVMLFVVCITRHGLVVSVHVHVEWEWEHSHSMRNGNGNSHSMWNGNTACGMGMGTQQVRSLYTWNTVRAVLDKEAITGARLEHALNITIRLAIKHSTGAEEVGVFVMSHSCTSRPPWSSTGPAHTRQETHKTSWLKGMDGLSNAR